MFPSSLIPDWWIRNTHEPEWLKQAESELALGNYGIEQEIVFESLNVVGACRELFGNVFFDFLEI